MVSFISNDTFDFTELWQHKNCTFSKLLGSSTDKMYGFQWNVNCLASPRQEANMNYNNLYQCLALCGTCSLVRIRYYNAVRLVILLTTCNQPTAQDISLVLSNPLHLCQCVQRLENHTTRIPGRDYKEKLVFCQNQSPLPILVLIKV